MGVVVGRVWVAVVGTGWVVVLGWMDTVLVTACEELSGEREREREREGCMCYCNDTYILYSRKYW